MTAAALALHLCEKPGLPEFLEDCTGLGRDGKFAELCNTNAAAKLHALRELFPHSRRHGGGTATRDCALRGSESALLYRYLVQIHGRGSRTKDFPAVQKYCVDQGPAIATDFQAQNIKNVDLLLAQQDHSVRD